MNLSLTKISKVRSLLSYKQFTAKEISCNEISLIKFSPKLFQFILLTKIWVHVMLNIKKFEATNYETLYVEYFKIRLKWLKS